MNANVIKHGEWRAQSDEFTAQVKLWTEPYRTRKGNGHKHPVHDFLFSYYSFSMGKLESWHPGFGHTLEAPLANHFNSRHYREINGSFFIDPTLIPIERVVRYRWILSMLESTRDRPANFSCFGLHEWAMVYQSDSTRHREDAPLRFSQEETNKIVEQRTIRCTHYDAYRFFTPPAHELNKLNPQYETRADFEQPGCLHTNMDLYKWCYKVSPLVSSDLLWKCFQLTKDVRELDMRASPYDLAEYHLSPIKIETIQGREEYEQLQRNLSQRAEPLRAELISQLKAVLDIAGTG